jgi:hypothetical protein
VIKHYGGGNVSLLPATWELGGGHAFIEQMPEPHLPVLPPEEALRRARPLPRRGQLVIDDVTAAEWDDFQRARSEA